jgi:hypothetical protein
MVISEVASRPTPADWCVRAVRVTGVLLAITLGGLGLWHTADPSFDPARWPLLWTAYAAVPLVAAVVGWPPEGRPEELRFLTGALAAFAAVLTSFLAVGDPWFWPAVALSVTALMAALAMGKAEWGQ